MIKLKQIGGFFDLVDRCLKYAKTEHRAFKRTEVAFKHLKEFFGNKNLSDITPLGIENYKQKRLSDGVKRSTINRELTCLKSSFNHALEWGLYHSFNPVKRVKFFKISKYPFRVLSDAEYDKLYNKATTHLKPILKCAINTGMRKSELLNLKWKDIDVLEGKITVMESKNFHYRVIPMNETLKAMFVSIDKLSENIFTYMGKPIKECHRSFNTAIRKANIEHCRLHDLRHTFATNLVMKGVDLVTLQELLGHKSIEMTRKYLHPTPENKRKAVESLVNNNEIPTSEETEKIPMEIH